MRKLNILPEKADLSNHDRMLQGLWYDANYDGILTAERERAKRLSRKPDRCSSPHRRRRILQHLLPQLPEAVEIQPPFYIDYGYNVHLGEHCHINHSCYFMDGAPIRLGNHVFVGPFVGFYTASHPLEAHPRKAGLEQAKPITVGDNCWLGPVSPSCRVSPSEPGRSSLATFRKTAWLWGCPAELLKRSIKRMKYKPHKSKNYFIMWKRF